MLEHTISKKAVSTIVEVSGMCTPQADSAGLPRGWIEIELAEERRCACLSHSRLYQRARNQIDCWQVTANPVFTALFL